MTRIEEDRVIGAADLAFMDMALEEARLAPPKREVPVGAVLVHDGQVLARAHNQREAAPDPTAHAEMLVLRESARLLGTWRLTGCDVYVTLEPCVMCTGALILARVDRVVFGTWDEKGGACGSVFDIPGAGKLNHHPVIVGGVRAEECGEMLSQFFRRLRGEAG